MPEEEIVAVKGELDFEERLLGILKSKVYGEANNGTLRRELGWEWPQYWTVRNRLLERGLVQKQRGGPGGSTALICAFRRL
jgi:hypothetical protein